MYACIHTYMAAVTFVHRGGSRIEAGINRRQAFIASLGNSGRHEKRQSCIQAITPAERMLAAAAWMGR